MASIPPGNPPASPSTLDEADEHGAVGEPKPIFGPLGTLWNRSRRGIYALTDQFVASGGNFATQLLVRRQLSDALFGKFVLIFDATLFLNSIQAALITYPMTVKGAHADDHRLGQLATLSLILTLFLAVPMGLAALMGGAVLGAPVEVAAAFAGLLAWQAQETLRRAIMAHLRHGHAIAGDAVAYLGMAAGVAALYVTRNLTVVGAFGMLALGFSAGAIVHALVLKPRRFHVSELKPVALRYWELGRWVVLMNLTSVISTLSYGWVLAAMHGKAAVGVFGSYALLLKFSNPLMNSIVGLVIPVTARAHKAGGVRPALKAASRYAFFGAVILLPYHGLIFFFPDFTVRLLGAHFDGDLGALRLFTVGYFLLYWMNIAGAFFNGIGKSRTGFYGHLAGVLSSALIGLPLTAYWGVYGAVLGGLICTIIQATAMVSLLHWVHSTAPDEDAEADLTNTPGGLG